MKFGPRLGCLVSSICLLSVSGWAQSVTSLRGRVTDGSHAALVGAQVKITLASTGATRTDQSDAGGNYQFQQLMPGPYSIEVSAPGFGTTISDNVVLVVASPATFNVTLSVASSTEKIEVFAPVQPLLNTSDATLGNAFDGEQIVGLPLEGRNVVELLSLQPGVTYFGQVGNSSGDSRSGAVNGARPDQSNTTLDGVDVNDENSGFAFTSVLRVTQDSTAEFRVTTSNPIAESGRGSGAQVALITRSGTNNIHGSAYEFNRFAYLAANDFFNKKTQLLNGEPNRQAKLIRNVFGASLGGPVRKDKVFAFFNYEATRRNEGASTFRTVPTDSFRAGNVKYQAADKSTVTLSPADIKNLDPLGIGNNAAMLKLLQSYPEPNDFSVGDGLNTAGYRFSQALASSFNNYIARVDWNVSAAHTLFWRGNLLGDMTPDFSEFPGQPSFAKTRDNSRGFAVGHTWALTPNLVNDFRWGLTRQSGSISGISNQPFVGVNGLSPVVAFSRTSSFHVPVNNFVDDLSWNKGGHILSFNANIRLIDDQRSSNQNSFPHAVINVGWLQPSSIQGSALDPTNAGFPAVDNSFTQSYAGAVLDLVGVVSEVDAVYNYSKTGAPIAFGAPLIREYKWTESDFAIQDSWKATPTLTLTAGLHYSYLQPPAEVNGTQEGACVVTGSACTPYALSDYLAASAAQGASGGAANKVPELSFDLNGRTNGRADFWKPDTKDFSPRVAFAFAPSLGGAGKTSIRGGYSLIFDHFGAGIVNTFDTNGTYGLNSQVANPAGVQTIASAPRFTGVSDIPTSLLPAAPPAGGFPATPDTSAFAISWSLDSKLKTPYSHVFDLSFQRQIGSNSSFELDYVGRLGRRLMEQEDVAMPLNLSAGGSNYFAAASAFARMIQQVVPVSNVPQSAYWEALFAPLAGQHLCDAATAPANATATQNVYCIFQQNQGNETNALFTLDLPGNVGAGTLYPAYRFFHDQYSALYAWRSIGRSSYHAFEASYRQRVGGLKADINYTYSHSIDWTSQAERIGASGGINNAQIINTWMPDQLNGTSDFDVTHQINANALWELPVGRGRRFLAGSSRLVDSAIGGWRMTGILRLTSGLPFEIDNGSAWPTNWDIEGFSTLAHSVPAAARKRGKLQQMFADPQAVFNSFRQALPGESGTRNPLRGDGYFRWDAGLNKDFPLFHETKLQFRAEVFNLTNSVRFDPHSISSRLDQVDNFGVAGSALAENRVMQLSGRIDF